MASPLHPAHSSGRPVPEGLDPATIDQLLGLDDGGTSLLAELFDLFRQDSPERLSQLRRNLDEGELQGVSEMAHALKGAAGTLGALRMRAVAFEMERGGKGGMPVEELRRLLQDLEGAYEEACAALAVFLGQA
ncbi:MAG: Hpt domain-containing protein [Acidobacteria bacterium]|nr:Hpt domain-containing protein [Acidobacteriota bacterium]